MHSEPSQPSTAAAAYYARFSDGKSASSRDVSVQLGITGVEISVVAPDEMVIWPYESLKAGEPVRTHAIDVLLTSTGHPGASLFVPSADFARSLRDFAPHLTAHAERLRNARPWIIGAAVAAGLIAIIYAAGWSPIRSITSVLPQTWRERLGDSAVTSMTEGHKLCTAPDGVAALEALRVRLSEAAGIDTPIKVVVEKEAHISPLVTAGLASVGIRIPGHDQARALLELCDLPIAAPSANRSGRPSCTTWQSVLEDMDGRIDYILRGEVCQVGLESTVVDCTGQSPIILRAGKITLQQLQSVIPTTQMADSILIESDQPLRQASPGVRHPHYQPRAVVKLFESVDELTKLTIDQRGRAAVVGLAPSNNRITSVDSLQGFILNKTLTSLEQYEREFYELLRHVDRCEIESIYLQLVGESDAAAALRDRQLRAAGMK